MNARHRAPAELQEEREDGRISEHLLRVALATVNLSFGDIHVFFQALHGSVQGSDIVM